MKIEAPPRQEVVPVLGLYGTQEGTRPEHIGDWIARVIYSARSTDPRPLADLKVTVGTEVRREILTTIAHLQNIDEMTHIFGAEFEVDHELDVPFVVTWTSQEEAIAQRIRQQYGDAVGIISAHDGRSF